MSAYIASLVKFHAPRIGRASDVAFAARRVCEASITFVRTIWIYRGLVNELDALTDDDFRGMPINRSDVSSVAWAEACRRVVADST